MMLFEAGESCFAVVVLTSSCIYNAKRHLLDSLLTLLASKEYFFFFFGYVIKSEVSAQDLGMIMNISFFAGECVLKIEPKKIKMRPLHILNPAHVLFYLQNTGAFIHLTWEMREELGNKVNKQSALSLWSLRLCSDFQHKSLFLAL